MILVGLLKEISYCDDSNLACRKMDGLEQNLFRELIFFCLLIYCMRIYISKLKLFAGHNYLLL